MRRRLPWLVMGLLLVGALIVGARPRSEPTEADRIRSISETVRCPTCAGQSVATSDAPAANAIRRQITRDVAAHKSTDEIRDRITAAYGDDILLTPSRSGLAGLVWILPVTAVVLAFAGLAYAFVRWQDDPTPAPTAEDRALVAAAARQSDLAPPDPHGEGDGA